MRVLDASAIAELLLATRAGERVAQAIAGRSLHAPHLLDLEVVSVLRRLVLGGMLSAAEGVAACRDLRALNLVRYPHDLLVPRIWQLRDVATAYDAAYLALAEALDAPLLTLDARLARAHGHRARVELLAPGL